MLTRFERFQWFKFFAAVGARKKSKRKV